MIASEIVVVTQSLPLRLYSAVERVRGLRAAGRPMRPTTACSACLLTAANFLPGRGRPMGVAMVPQTAVNITNRRRLPEQAIHPLLRSVSLCPREGKPSSQADGRRAGSRSETGLSRWDGAAVLYSTSWASYCTATAAPWAAKHLTERREKKKQRAGEPNNGGCLRKRWAM